MIVGTGSPPDACGMRNVGQWGVTGQALISPGTGPADREQEEDKMNHDQARARLLAERAEVADLLADAESAGQQDRATEDEAATR